MADKIDPPQSCECPVRNSDSLWLQSISKPFIRFLQRELEWIGWHEATVLMALLLIVLATWAFVAIADRVSEGRTQSFDDWALRVFRQTEDPAVPIGPDWTREMGRDLTALGGLTVLTLLTFAVAGFLLIQGKSHAMWLVLVSTFGGFVAMTLLKSVYQRARPDLVPHLTTAMLTSFPSGHSMLSTAVFLTLGVLLAQFVPQRPLKAYCLLVALILAFLVGVSRVYLGVHYPTDVLAGWAAGLAWALICWLIARYLQRRGAVEQ